MQHSKDKIKSKDEFTQDMRKLRERIADLEAAQKRSKDIEKIITIQRNLALALNETHDLNKGLQLCLEAAIKASGMDCGGVYLVDDASGNLNLVYHTGLPVDFVQKTYRYDAASQNTKLVMAGRPVYSKHKNLGIQLDKTKRKEMLLAIGVIPVLHNKKVIACLNVASHKLEEIPVHLRNSLEAIAGQIGGAIAHMKVENALKESEEKLSTTLHKSPIPTAVGGSDGSIISFNEALEKIIGYKQSEIKDVKGWTRKLYPDKKYRNFVERNIQQALAGQKQDCTEFIITCKNGSKKNAEFHTSFYKDGLIIQILDITERKKTEENLANERKYLKIMNDVSNVLNRNGSLNDVTDIILKGLNLHGANIGILEKDNILYVKGSSTDLSKIFAHAARSLFFDFNSNATARDYFNFLNEAKTLSVQELLNLISDKGSLSSKIINTLITELTKASVGETVIAPLKSSAGDRIGAVLLTKKPGQIFNPQERSLVDSLCGTLALAINKNNSQLKLGESEKRYRLLLESLSDSVYVLDREWRHIVVNDAASRFANLPREKLLGNTLIDLFPGIDHTPFFKIFKKVMESRRPDIVTNEYLFENGRKGWYEVHVYPVPEGILCISRDITEQKRAEEKADEEKARAQKYLDIAGTMFVAIDTEGTVTLVNKKGCEILGYNEDEIVGKNWFENFVPERLKNEILPVSHTLLTGKIEGTEYYENPVLTKKGKERLIAWHNTVIRDESGKIIGHLSSGEDITEKKQAQLKIKESQERLNAIFENVQTGIFIIDEETHRIYDVNSTAAKMIGLPKEKIVIQECYRFVCPAEKGKCPISDLGQTVDNSERILLCGKKGEKVPILKTVAPMILNGHKYLVESFVDLTEKKRAEEQLIASEQKYRIIFESANDVIAQIDHLGTILNVNKKIEDMFGYKPSEVIGKHFTKLPIVKLSEIPKVIGIFKDMVVNKKKTYLMELKMLHKNGKEIFIEVSTERIDKNGKPDHFLCIIRDITERRKAEEFLRQSELKYRTLSENIPGMVYRVYAQENNRMEFFSEGIAEEFTGYSLEELQSGEVCSIDPLIIPEHRELVVSKVKKAIANDEMFEVEYDIINKQGSIRNFLERGKGIKDSNGKLQYIDGVIFDITERMQMQEQLRQSEKMESIGQLAGGIAHDFNNQLGSIVGFADLIRERVMDDERLYRYADNILITAKRSADITKQLLAFARKGKYKSVRVDIHKTIYEVISLLKHSIHKKIVIKQHLNANPSTTSGDPSQLQNAILNIALNARDAMPKGGELTFTTDTVHIDEKSFPGHRYRLTPGAYLQISVSDTGTGIDKETQQRIFEPFFTTKEVGEGTGMGLAAVYGTIKNHKGGIDVYSEPGHGTVFKIYLPLSPEGTGEETGLFEKSALIKGSAHILLADDEEILCEMARDMIETLGYKTTICKNGKEAMEVYKKSWKDIDLVILDMIMPEMDGKDAYLEMKKINPDIKVLLSSGYSMTGTARELLSRGVDDFIQKPYRKAELSQKIAKVLNSE